MEPGQSKIALLMKKRLEAVSNDAMEQVAKPIEIIEKVSEGEDSNKKINDNKEIKEKISGTLAKKEVDLMNDPKMQAFVNTLIQTVKESVDHNIKKRHPAYKGPRVQRTYKIKEMLDNWLDNVHNDKRIDKSQMVDEALENYLNVNYAEYKPQNSDEL